MRRKKELKRDPGISKEYALKELVSRGYDARLEGRLVRVYVDENDHQEAIRDVLGIFREIKYKRDCGFAKKGTLCT